MKYTELYVQILLIVKSKRDVDLFFESRNTPRDGEDILIYQTHFFIYDHYTKETLLMRFYDDSNPEEHKIIKKDIYELQKKLGSPNKDDEKKFGKYLHIYQGLINRTKKYNDIVFKLVMIQLKGNQTSFSLEGGKDPVMFYVDEDQEDSYRDLLKMTKMIQSLEEMAEEDDQMNIL